MKNPGSITLSNRTGEWNGTGWNGTGCNETECAESDRPADALGV